MISTTKRLLINEWITSSDESLRELTLDDPIIETVFEFLDGPESDLELLKAITKKLYEIYQTGDERLRLLTLCFLPPLVAIYIRVAHNYYNLPKLEFHSLAILLLMVYNCEIVEPSTEAVDQGRLKTIDVRVISLSKPSIYHEPNSHTNSQAAVPAIPTEQNVARLNNPNESKISIFGPYEEVEQLLASNYMSVCTVLLKVYNHHISEMGTFSHGSLCQFFLRLLKQGMNIDIKEKIKEYLQDSTNVQYTTSHHHQHQRPHKGQHHSVLSQQHQMSSPVVATSLFMLPRNSVQIQFGSPFLVELTRSVYYCFYNDMTDIAYELLGMITKKATLKMYTDVLLMVNAIKNSIAIKRDRDRMIEGNTVESTEKTGAPHTTSMNSLNSFTSVGPHESKWSSIRKTAITNASFKTRKLPDDIPIITGNLPSTHGGGVATAHQGGSSSSASSKSGTPVSTRTPPSSNAGSHHHQHALVLQNSKNLDSIDEESSDKLLLANGEERRSTKDKKSGGKKNSVMNLLKELKEAKPKLPKMSNNKENGKLLNNSNHHNASLNHSKASMDSDTSGISDGCGKASLTDGEDGHESIPMKSLHHYTSVKDTTTETDSDDDEDEVDGVEANGGSQEVLNGGPKDGGHRGSSGTTATMTTGGDDDEVASDRSGSSSKGLLSNSKQKQPSGDSKSGPTLKLSVQ